MGSSLMDVCKVQDLRNHGRSDGEKRCLCCLPMELLVMVLGYLSILDYLSFRVVCKCWHSAFSKCSAFISQKQLPRQLPWFMLLRSEEFPEELHFRQNKQHSLLTGKFGDLSSERIYNSVIPELCETRFLLSRHGWLLLFSSKNESSFLFFFNPFSRARIDIPLIDVNKLWHPVFDVSAPPTSPDCVVLAISCHNFCIEIRTCCRRESAWKSNSYEYHCVSGHVVNTVLVSGIWYCLHESGSFSAFDVVNNRWRFLGLPEGMTKGSQATLVSYVIKRGTQVYLCVHGNVFNEVLLEEPLKVTRNFKDKHWQISVEYLMRTCPERAFELLQNEMEVFNTFNVHAWCVACNDTEDEVEEFRWHNFWSCLNKRYQLDDWNCPRNNEECSTIVAWIEPVWVHPSADLRWML